MEGLVLLGNSITAGLLVVLLKVNSPVILEKINLSLVKPQGREHNHHSN